MMMAVHDLNIKTKEDSVTGWPDCAFFVVIFHVISPT